MKLAKLEYKSKVERELLSGNASDAWNGLNRMMGRTRKEQPLVSDNPAKFASDLNRFMPDITTSTIEMNVIYYVKQ